MPRTAWLHTGGCDFAVDPALRGDQVHPVWLPLHDARVAMIESAEPSLSAGTTYVALDGLEPVEAAPEGDYHKGGSRDSIDILRLSRGGPPNAALIPFDDLFLDRIAVALAVWRAARRGTQAILPLPTSAQLRRRKLLLRALDADLAGISYREIAAGLFGGKRMPAGSAWRQHHLRSLTIRLVQDGRTLMRGGYLRLLRLGRRGR